VLAAYNPQNYLRGTTCPGTLAAQGGGSLDVIDRVRVTRNRDRPFSFAP
jgi:hypothetical protein